VQGGGRGKFKEQTKEKKRKGKKGEEIKP